MTTFDGFTYCEQLIPYDPFIPHYTSLKLVPTRKIYLKSPEIQLLAFHKLNINV